MNRHWSDGVSSILVLAAVAVVGGGSLATALLVIAIVAMWMLASARHLGWIAASQISAARQ